MTQQFISSDIDEILLEFVPFFLHWHNDNYGTHITRNDMHTYDFEKVIGCERKEMLHRVKQFYESAHFKRIVPVEGALEGVAYLETFTNLAAVTGRPPDMQEGTRACLDLFFPHTFERVHYTNVFETKLGKGKVCKELGVRAHLEDNLENATDVASHGIPVVLLDCPWNQGKEPRGVVRVYSWNEIPPAVEKLLR